jgi:hypothetical protein
MHGIAPAEQFLDTMIAMGGNYKEDERGIGRVQALAIINTVACLHCCRSDTFAAAYAATDFAHAIGLDYAKWIVTVIEMEVKNNG